MVETSPHGEGDVRDHINKEYDPDEDGLVEIGELDGEDDTILDLDSDGDSGLYYDTATNRIKFEVDGAIAFGFSSNAMYITMILVNLIEARITRGDMLLQLGEQDLTAAGAPAPSSPDKYATHDGTGAPAAGLYRSDSANNQWVKVEDNTVTIAY